MTKLYDKSSRERGGGENPEMLLLAVQEFLRKCSQPAVLDYGDEPLCLSEGSYVLEVQGGKLLLEAWGAERARFAGSFGRRRASSNAGCSVSAERPARFFFST